MIFPVSLFWILALFAFAYANGSNDISKGIATLVGSGVTNYRRAILWGSAWTVAGALVAALFSRAMLATFSKGVIDPQFDISNRFLMAVIGGAIVWVLFATKIGLPVSTTHAITGALCGVAMIAYGWQGILWGSVSQKILFPLLLSPLLAFAALWTLFPLLRLMLTPLSRECACAQAQQLHPVCVTPFSHGIFAESAVPKIHVVVGHLEDCQARRGMIPGIKLDDLLHWASSGLTSFARGLNDAPKIVALGLPLSLILNLSSSWMFVLVALGMGLGSIIAGLRVTETLAEKITRMSTVEGLSANLITSFLVAFASHWGVPVSTTHVSSGAIIGLGLRRPQGSVQWKTVGLVLQAWIVTLPAAAILASAGWWILQKVA